MQTPSSKTLVSNPTKFSWVALTTVSRLTVGVDQLCKDTRNGDPGRMLGMKQETVGNGAFTTAKYAGSAEGFWKGTMSVNVFVSYGVRRLRWTAITWVLVDSASCPKLLQWSLGVAN